MTAPIKLEKDEIDGFVQAIKTSPLMQAMNVFRACIAAGTVVMYIRTVSKNPFVFEVDIAGTLIDPLTGESREVKFGSLSAPELMPKEDEPTNDTEPIRSPASLH